MLVYYFHMRNKIPNLPQKERRIQWRLFSFLVTNIGVREKAALTTIIKIYKTSHRHIYVLAGFIKSYHLCVHYNHIPKLII